MAEIKRVAVAGAGRVGLPVVQELARQRFDVTVLTRNSNRSIDFPAGVTVCAVDYDYNESLQNALKGQDAVVSTVAMSAVTNQKRMIDAAVAIGVRYFIPAEYTLATRNPKAQWLPVYSTVLDIQKYLSLHEDKMNWMVINCGGLLEFSFDYPFILDFDNCVATLWDGGDGATSLSNVTTVAKAVAGVLKQPERVENHGVRVHGGTLSQKEALRIARKFSTQEWTEQERESEPAIQEFVGQLSNAASLEPAEMTKALIGVIAAATFGKGHFEGAYSKPDNDWLGVDAFGDEIEDAIRRRVTQGTWALQTGTSGDESMSDVANGIAAKFNESTT